MCPDILVDNEVDNEAGGRGKVGRSRLRMASCKQLRTLNSILRM